MKHRYACLGFILMIVFAPLSWADDWRGYGGYGDRYGGGYDRNNLWSTVSEIERVAELLDERVTRAERRHDLDEDNVNRLQRINDAAEKLFERVRAGDDRDKVVEEYHDLIDRLREARGVVRNFSPTTQDYYSRLWWLTSRISYIDPEYFDNHR